MKYFFFLVLSIFATSTAHAFCVEAAAVIQIDIHSESGAPSQQNVRLNQHQGDNCFGNININKIEQVHSGFDGGKQTVIIDSHQDTPAEENPLRQHGIDLRTPSIKTNVIIQHEIILPDSVFNGINLNK